MERHGFTSCNRHLPDVKQKSSGETETNYSYKSASIREQALTITARMFSQTRMETRMKTIGFWIYDTYNFFFQSQSKSFTFYTERVYTVYTDVLSVGHVDSCVHALDWV